MSDPGLYFDNNATTAVDERVLAALLPFFRETYGNPASLHRFGEAAAEAVEDARAETKRLFGARSASEIVFTSGGTEALNAGIAAALADRTRADGWIALTSTVEHAAVLAPLAAASAAGGGEVRSIPVDRDGRLEEEALFAAIEEAGGRLALLALQAANNETGVKTPDELLARAAEAVHARGGRVLIDAVQLPGKAELDVNALGADFAALSAHKFHGPKGVGALYIAREAQGAGSSALVRGGSQEDGRRGGTLNVPGIVGLGRAARLAREHVAAPGALAALADLRDALEAGLQAALPGLSVLGQKAPRLPNTATILFPGQSGQALQAYLAAEGLAVSTGAACSSRQRAPSPVLMALGLDAAQAAASLRFSLSRETRPEEVEAALALTVRAVRDLGGLTP